MRHSGESDRRTLRAEELARDVEGLAADNNDLLTIEKLLSDDGGETAKEVALAIDDDLSNVWLADCVSQCALQSESGVCAAHCPTEEATDAEDDIHRQSSHGPFHHRRRHPVVGSARCSFRCT